MGATQTTPTERCRIDRNHVQEKVGRELMGLGRAAVLIRGECWFFHLVNVASGSSAPGNAVGGRNVRCPLMRGDNFRRR